MNSLTIKAKLYLITLLISVVFIGAGAGAIYALSVVNHKSTELADIWMQQVAFAGKINTATSDYRLAQYNHVVSQTQEAMARQDAQMAKMKKEIDELFVGYSNVSVDQRQRDVVAAVKSEWGQYMQGTETMLALSRENKQQEAIAILAGAAKEQYDKVSNRILEMQEISIKKGEAASEAGDAYYSTTSTVLTTVIAVSIVILLAVMFILIRWMIKRFTLLSSRLEVVAAGDLKDKIVITTDDELGRIGKSINLMIDSLVSLVSQIQNTAQQVAASAEELTASADQSAQVTQQIAKSITDVSELSTHQVTTVNTASSATEQMSAGVEETSATVSSTAEQAGKAVETAKDGNEIISGAVKQMQSIEATVNESAQVVTKLGQRSKEIGQIVDTIAGIAGQTNLLALNAAIEAARAGEQGKGFAVVAEEVRKLAEQSQEAAKQIGELIAEIQKDTDNAVVAMSSGTQEVRAGTEVVNKAGAAFERILEMVDAVSRQSSEVATTMEELAKGTQEIVQATQEIDGSSKNVASEAQSVSAATEEQSASMEEIAAGSRSLATLAQELQAASNKFKI